MKLTRNAYRQLLETDISYLKRLFNSPSDYEKLLDGITKDTRTMRSACWNLLTIMKRTRIQNCS